MTQAIAYNSCTPTTQFTYVANVDPLPLITSSEGAEPVIGSLQVVITTGDEGPYTITSDDSISFAIPYCDPDANPPCSTGGVMQNVNDATPSWFDDTNEWTFSLQGTEDGVGVFTLSPVGSFTLPSGYTFGVELAGFETVEQPCVSTVNIAESVGGTTGINCFDVATFPVGFFFNSLEAVGATGSDPAPLAEVPNGTQVRLNWNSSAITQEQIAIYMSGASGAITPTEIDHWITPNGLTDDTVFTVAITADVSADDPITLSLSVAVTVAQPDIPARSLTASGAVTAASITASTATINGPFTLVNGLGTPQLFALPDVNQSNGYTATADGFVMAYIEGFYPQTGSAPGAPMYVLLESGNISMYTYAGYPLQGLSDLSLATDSLWLPVRAGEAFSIFVNCPGGMPPGYTPEGYLMYVPFGSGVATQQSTAVKPAVRRSSHQSRFISAAGRS